MRSKPRILSITKLDVYCIEMQVGTKVYSFDIPHFQTVERVSKMCKVAPFRALNILKKENIREREVIL